MFKKPRLAFIPESKPEILSNVHLCKQDQLSSYLNVTRTHHLPNLKAEVNAVNTLRKNQMYSLVGQKF